MLCFPPFAVEIMSNTMKRPSVTGKLSKRFLFGLPEEAFLVSNVMDAPGQPIFAQTVRPSPPLDPPGADRSL